MNNNSEIFGVIEKSTGLIAGLSSNLAACNAVAEHSLGLYNINPHMQIKCGFEMIKEQSWFFKVDPTRMIIVKHDYIIDTKIYEDISKRLFALNKITRNLQWQKNKYKQLNNDLNELILIVREQQAKEFLAGSKDDLPYIREYANALEISEEMAARDILIKSQIMHTDLAKIESLRLRYTKKIFDNDTSCIDEILAQFRKECWFNN